MKTIKTIKPWGWEEIIEINDNYVVKKIFLKKNCRCSLQYHAKKRETIIILNGKMNLTIKKKKIILYLNDIFTIKPEEMHRMEAIEDCTYVECSTPELDDVIRIKDDYERITK